MTVNLVTGRTNIISDQDLARKLHFYYFVHGGNESSKVIVEIFSSSSATKTLTLEINRSSKVQMWTKVLIISGSSNLVLQCRT